VPSQLECDGAHAQQFYAALLSFALYWNATLEREQMMEVELPGLPWGPAAGHGVAAGAGAGADLGNFARHSIVREMITRRGGLDIQSRSHLG
jgi:hypothetical protein